MARQSDQLQKTVSQREAEIRRLQTELDLAASRLTSSHGTPRTEPDRNVGASAVVEGLREELDAARRLYQAELQASRLASEQVKRLQTERTALDDRLRQSHANLQALERQLAIQNQRIAELDAAYEKLKRDNQTLFLTSQNPGILGAPDLRVVSVDNIINKSLRTRAFGRIISAEGYRSRLCLFGLSPKEETEAAGQYEVWALRQIPPMDEIAKTTLHWKGTSEGSARRLGAPMLDAADKDRWVLDVGDRSALMSANYILVLDEESAVEPGAAPVLFLGKVSR